MDLGLNVLNVCSARLVLFVDWGRNELRFVVKIKRSVLRDLSLYLLSTSITRPLNSTFTHNSQHKPQLVSAAAAAHHIVAAAAARHIVAAAALDPPQPPPYAVATAATVWLPVAAVPNWFTPDFEAAATAAGLPASIPLAEMAMDMETEHTAVADGLSVQFGFCVNSFEINGDTIFINWDLGSYSAPEPPPAAECTEPEQEPEPQED
eukprot:SAG22_NODE_62_length_23371_cov_84.500602_24_plen_207_part_00